MSALTTVTTTTDAPIAGAPTTDVTIVEANGTPVTPVVEVTTTPTVNPHVAAVLALMEAGDDMTTAIGKRVAETGTPRATVYGAMRRAGHTGNATVKAPVDPIEAAKALLEAALANVDKDVAALKVASEDAVAAYKTARDGAKDKKADLKARIAALTA